MFGFGKKKLFEQHQRNLLTCLLFGEFALNSAEESANSDQIEFWETKIGKLRRLQGASLRTGGILDKNDATFVDTFLEKCEATFYESGGGGEKSFEETFAAFSVDLCDCHYLTMAFYQNLHYNYYYYCSQY